MKRYVRNIGMSAGLPIVWGIGNIISTFRRIPKDFGMHSEVMSEYNRRFGRKRHELHSEVQCKSELRFA